jgi:hypothetical protein
LDIDAGIKWAPRHVWWAPKLPQRNVQPLCFLSSFLFTLALWHSCAESVMSSHAFSSTSISVSVQCPIDPYHVRLFDIQSLVLVPSCPREPQTSQCFVNGLEAPSLLRGNIDGADHMPSWLIQCTDTSSIATDDR